MKKYLLLVLLVLVLSGCNRQKAATNTSAPAQEAETSMPYQPGQIPTNVVEEPENTLPTMVVAELSENDIDLSDQGEVIDGSAGPMEYDLQLTYVADLTPVDGSQSSGTATAGTTANDLYIVQATFSNLPEPGDDFFYEGWIVRPNPQSVISTGSLEKGANGYFQTYSDIEDRTDHSKYILTIEPKYDGPDGTSPDPAPAEHVVEGTFVLQ